MRKLIILSGEACTGKTTVGRALAAELGYLFQSAGNHARHFAQTKHGKDVHAFQELCAADLSIDRKMDDDFCQAIRQALDHDASLVADFRMGAYFFPAAMSIYLKASPGVVRQRLEGRAGEDYASLCQRNEVSRRRLNEIYRYDYAAESNYRHVIDTDSLTSKQIVEQIVKFRKAY